MQRKNKRKKYSTSPRERSGAKSTSQTQPANTQAESYVAKVPVKVLVGHSDIIVQEFETVIAIDFSDRTTDGKEHIALLQFLTREQGLPTEEALLTIATTIVNKAKTEIITQFSMPTYEELSLHVKQNGAITYGTYV